MRKPLCSLTIACIVCGARAAWADQTTNVYDITLDRGDFFTRALAAVALDAPAPFTASTLPALPTLALHLWLVIVAVSLVARALPRTRRRVRLQAASAARARSLIRWTIARNPFERCDDR